jgi:hypothetical protein
MKTLITIKGSFGLGTDIENAFKESVRVATILDCCIEFDFKGISCMAKPGDDPNECIDDYIYEFNTKNSKGSLIQS